MSTELTGVQSSYLDCCSAKCCPQISTHSCVNAVIRFLLNDLTLRISVTEMDKKKNKTVRSKNLYEVVFMK